MASFERITKNLKSTVAKLEKLARNNLEAVEENTGKIEYLHKVNTGLIAETTRANNVASNIKQLLGEPVE